MSAEAIGPAPRKRRPLSTRRRVLYAALTLVVVFGLAEGALRLAGFNYTRTPRVVQQGRIDQYITFQNETYPQQLFQPHPTRMWAPVPGRGWINEDGFQGARLEKARTPGRLRILFLGDSCTTAGEDGFPEQVIARLERRGIAAEALIAGVGGYSTTQGLEMFRDALPWRPDLVVAFYGWNDHWLSPHADHEFEALGPLQLFATTYLSRLRVYQALHALIYPPVWFDPAREYTPYQLMERARVPPARYRANIARMAEDAREQGLPIFFVAAPMGPHIVETDKSSLIVKTRLVPFIHEHYRGLLREAVAEAPGAHLVELEDARFDRRLMGLDGVHPNRAGNAAIAERIVEVLRASGLVPGGSR